MTTVLIDNYDSFSYNLYQMIGAMDPDIKVFRNDVVTVDGVLRMEPDRIVLSPGPGRPSDAGICEDLALRARGVVPVLGVCLGHQAICEAYGATVTYASRLMHGKSSEVELMDSVLFEGIGKQTVVGRYHSLAVDAATLPHDLDVTARTRDGEVMAVEDRTNKVFGVQFHPESILTPDGGKMLLNFMGVRM